MIGAKNSRGAKKNVTLCAIILPPPPHRNPVYASECAPTNTLYNLEFIGEGKSGKMSLKIITIANICREKR